MFRIWLEGPSRRYRTGKSFLLDLMARYLKMKAADAAKAL